MKGINKAGNAYFTDGKPLTAGSDNVMMLQLHRAARDWTTYQPGDFIDSGLELLRLLNQHGFDVIEKEGAAARTYAEGLPGRQSS